MGGFSRSYSDLAAEREDEAEVSPGGKSAWLVQGRRKSSFPSRVLQPWDPEWRGSHPFQHSSLSCSAPALPTVLLQKLPESETHQHLLWEAILHQTEPKSAPCLEPLVPASIRHCSCATHQNGPAQGCSSPERISLSSGAHSSPTATAKISPKGKIRKSNL